MAQSSRKSERTYQRVYAVVRQIPPGRIATYGQIAGIVDHCTARMVGYALASLPKDSDVPWQRVINAQGKISPRGESDMAASVQQELLEEEGVRFSADRKVHLATYRWSGPDLEWLIDNGFDPAPSWTEKMGDNE
jgi:methylated-DNA-protein-cysteine methyltransferase-like protein